MRYGYRSLALGLAYVALTSCGGGSSSPMIAAPTPSPVAAKSPVASASPGVAGASHAVSGNLSLYFPPARPSAARRHRAFLSPSAASVSIAVTGMPSVVADISASSPNCTTTTPSPSPSGGTTGGSTRSCTVTVLAPVGEDTFVATLYDGAMAGGNELGTGSAMQTVYASTPFMVQIAVVGIESAIAVSASPSTFTIGTSGMSSVTLAVTDADENAIDGTYATPITLTNSDTTGTFVLSTTNVTSSTTAVTLTYSGTGTATSATISATASGVSAANVTPQVVTASPPVANLYVAEQSSNAFTVTRDDASGNAGPSRTVSGSNTTLNNPVGIAVDANGTTYVTSTQSGSASNLSVVDVFAAGANGNAVPSRTISGADTGLSEPLSIAVDSSGDLYASNNFGGNVTEYAPGASGDAVPTRTISYTGLPAPGGIAVDASSNVYVINNSRSGGRPDAVFEFAPNPGPSATPIRSIVGSATGLSNAIDLALDSAGNVYVTSANTDSIAVFGPNQNGNVAPQSTISGTNTMLSSPLGIALDSAGNIYVTNQANQQGGIILVFAAGASGNVAPIRTITGSATGIDQPYELRIGP